MYTQTLSKFPFEQVQSALGEIAMTSKFFPSLAEIVEKIQGGGVDTEADELSGLIVSQIKSYSRDNAGMISRSIGAIGCLAVDMAGGWEILINTPYSAMDNLRAQLRRVCATALRIARRNPDQARLAFQKTTYLNFQEKNNSMKQLSFAMES